MSKQQEKTETTTIWGITEEEEKQTLARIIAVAEENLNRTRETVENLSQELGSLQEVYDVSDKEGLAQWYNTDARLKQEREALLRAQRGRSKPYFGRIDFTDATLLKPESYYIGRGVIAKDAAHPLVIDWRAPIASVYYEKSLGKCKYTVKGEGSFEIDLARKRTYEIENDVLKDFYDTDVVANDELLTKYLAKNKRAVLSDIIATIQQEQNEVIRKNPKHNIIVQGSAGSGKTTVAMHRISYILYNYDNEFKPKDFYIIGSNKILLNYITGILPDLDVYGISQMTMEQLFVRLLYEDWDSEKYKVKRQDKRDSTQAVKGTLSWFQDLEAFCRCYEWNCIPRKDIKLESSGALLLGQAEIEHELKRFDALSMVQKQEKLNERLMTQLEKELYGKFYTYSVEEKKRLTRKYQNHFTRREWKGSIFKLYEEFLNQQRLKDYAVKLPDGVFDLYDLAALAYIYKKIKETQVIQEASHVVIDEAQDFGMMVYGALKYCLSKCTYTIMGDVSQNIYFDYGLPDWEELKALMLPDSFDYFGLLRKSYRNTVEISEFATKVLRHGSFPVYPVEPIVRHGKEVFVKACAGGKELISQAEQTIQTWQREGYETIAVICSDESEAGEVTEQLASLMQVRQFDAQTEEFGAGVMVVPIEYAKGLEFDAVLLFDASEQKYPMEDGYAKLLYVAATRALHELVVLYAGRLTPLIASPLPREKQMQTFEPQLKKSTQIEVEEDTRTRKEIEAQRAEEGHREMALRNKYGPKRIEVTRPRAEAEPKAAYARSFIGNTVSPKAVTGVKPISQMIARQKNDAQTKEAKRRTKNAEFGTLPDSTSLRPMGHPALNYAIRWSTANKEYAELTTACGLLRLTPITASSIRVTFARQQAASTLPIPEELSGARPVQWSVRELRDCIEISTDRLLVRADKRSGVLSFYTVAEKLLLTENPRLPRQLGMAPKYQTWNYFNWQKKEVLKARGEADQWLDLEMSAKYISFGSDAKQPACIQSGLGYQILVPAGIKVMCCTIPTYGPYLYTEGQTMIDYFFVSGH